MLTPLRDGEVELLLVGVGARAQPLPSGIYQHLRARGIGVEIMDTGAACRTF